MRWSTMAATVAFLVGPATAAAQDLFPNVEYISGRAGMEDKKKGTLLIGDSEVKLMDKKGGTILTIPLSAITEATNSTERGDAGLVKKAAFGIFAGSKKEDYLVISTETATEAEGIVFRVHEKNVAPGLVAKLRFRLGKLKATEDTVGHPRAPGPR